MIYRHSRIDTSRELHIHRFRQGIKLLRSDQQFNSDVDRQPTLGSLLQLPCSIYFETADGVIRQLNQHNADYCGFDSVHQAIGKEYFQAFSAKTIQHLRANDSQVLQSEKTVMVDEDIWREHEDSVRTLSIKTPWYNAQDKLIGLFGCSILLGKNPLAEILSTMASLGLLHGNKWSSSSALSIFSYRQLQCAKQLMAGKTTKEIAKQLQLSPRTVDHYIDNIKIKLNCRNKPELINKLTEMLGSSV